MIAYLRTFLFTETPLKPIGLTNQGTDCCFNSAMQLLYHTPSWQSLVSRSMRWAYNCGQETSLHPIRESFHIPGQPNHAQEQTDPMEYIRATAEYARKTMNVRITRNGTTKKEKEAPLLSLAMPRLSLFSSYTLPSLLEHYFDDKNPTFHTTKELTQAPQDLLVCIQRFQTTRQNSWITSFVNLLLRLFSCSPIAPSVTTHKVSSNVQMNLSLTLKREWIYKAKSPISYEAQAFICHSGFLNFGHYISYVKTHDQQWWKCNDSVITPISQRQAEAAIKQSYVISYKKL